MGRVTLRPSAFYRFPERLPESQHQSQEPALIYLTGRRWTGDRGPPSAAGPPALRPAWCARPDLRSWRLGATGGAGRRGAERKRTHRGCSAGRRHRLRRHRTERDARRLSAPTDSVAPRVPICPERLSQRRRPGPAAAPARGAGGAGGGRPVPSPPLRIGHLNVRSLMPSIDDVIIILDLQKLDILCLSETWLHPDFDDNFLVFPGYMTVTPFPWAP